MQLLRLDSLRVTIEPGKFRWWPFRYEAEVRVSPVYSGSDAPDSLIVFVDVETPGATFWVNEEEGQYVKSDYLTIYKNQVQAKGMVSWLFSGYVQVTAKTNRLRTTKEASVNFPVLILLACLIGGGLGGWLRRGRDSGSRIELPARWLPSKWSRRLESVHEMAISMIIGLLVFLLNFVSPVYLDFRAGLNEGWLVLAQPLLIGFAGGWGGIHLLAGVLGQVIKSEKAGEARRSPVVRQA